MLDLAIEPLKKADGLLAVAGEHDQKVIDQALRCLGTEDGSLGFLSGDAHFGYSAPIGLSWALRDHVSPAAVGYDIGCGNMAVATSVMAQDLKRRNSAGKTELAGVMDRVYSEVSFGMGRRDGGVADHPVFDKIRHADYEPQREWLADARKQLGTVGAGNHYVDLFEDESGRVWIGVHFGSRGFGHRTATAFLNIAAREHGRAKYKEDMEAPPDLLHIGSGAGETYMRAMALAGEYAYAGREVVVEQVLNILGAKVFGEPVHNHHNFAWREEHRGEQFVVIRKGATPAFPGQKGFVGSSMGEPSVILEGVDGPYNDEMLFSTVHGAGRAMSRTAAAGKSKKRWSCNNRDCEWVQQPREHVAMNGKPQDWLCPECGHRGMRKVWVRETVGVIDWKATTADLKAKGIELRGANAEEAPGAYKRLDEVLAHHAGSIEVLHRLVPLGVAMADGGMPDD